MCLKRGRFCGHISPIKDSERKGTRTLDCKPILRNQVGSRVISFCLTLPATKDRRLSRHAPADDNELQGL